VQVRDGRATVTGGQSTGSQRLSRRGHPYVRDARSRRGEHTIAQPSEPATAAVKRLLLVRHAQTAATRAAAFAGDEQPLDARGRVEAGRIRDALPRGLEVISSPALRCLETAREAGYDPTPDPRLTECDFGRWVGMSLQQVHEADPAGAVAWMENPDAAPHQGESLTQFARRVGEWLDEQARGGGRTLAVTHAGVIRAAVVKALSAPIAAFWQIDAAPLSVTELHAHDGRWRVVRTNCDLVGVPA
jgi:broad specificity phosphatase PhoE